MKVVYEGALFPGVGGGPRHFAGLSDGLARTGIDVVQVLPRHSPVARSVSVAELVEVASPGGRLLRQFTYEIGRALLVLKWWVTGRRFDVWMSRHSLFGIGLTLTRLVAHRVVLEVNGPVREEMLMNFGSQRAARLAESLFIAQARAADLVIAVTPGLARYVSDRAPSTPCEVLPNGADTAAALGGREQTGRPLPLVFVGALTPWYEMGVILEALRRLHDGGRQLSMVVVGDGVLLDGLRARAAQLAIEHLVTFTGWVDIGEVRAHVRSARVGLLPLTPKYQGLEAVGSPLKLYEYVAAGLRVVGTDVDGIANSPVQSAVHTYQVGDPITCAAAIIEALDKGPSPPADEATWSWTARARELVRLVE
jgi:glycosyltransferase involved in cell wall biosynthesis